MTYATSRFTYTFTTLAARSRLALLSLALPLLGGCPNTENTTETASSDSSTGEGFSTTDAEDTSTTADTDPTSTSTEGVTEGDTLAGETEGGATNTTVDATDGGTDGETDTDTGLVPPPPELEGACTAACENLLMCGGGPFATLEECVADCAQDAPGSQECLDVTVAFNNCLGTMTCEQLKAALENNDPGPCIDEVAQLEGACSGNLCNASIGSNEEMTECSYEVECEEQPTNKVECAGGTCVCFVDGQQTAECDVVDVCAEVDQGSLEAVAQDCCGFE